MALTDPKTQAPEGADASFEIEEGHFGPHLPRPNWEIICSVGGAVMLFIGSYLPWFAITQQGFDQGPNGPGPTTHTIQFGGWGVIFSHPSGTQNVALGVAGFILLIALPAVVGLVAFAMNILWYRHRASAMSCGVAVSALLIGVGLLFAETAVLLLMLVLYTGLSANNALSIQAGYAFPLMYLGYFGLTIATFAMCVGFWQDSKRPTRAVG